MIMKVMIQTIINNGRVFNMTFNPQKNSSKETLLQ